MTKNAAFGFCALVYLTVAVLCATSGHAQTPQREEVRQDAIALEISRILLHRESRDPRRVEESFIDRLAGLGERALPDLFAILVAGRVPVETTDGGRLSRHLDPWHERVLRAALVRAPRPALVALLAQLTENGDEGTRVEALTVLASVGKRADLELLAELGNPPAGRPRATRGQRAAFDAALTGIADRDPRALSQLTGLFGIAHPSHITTIVRCAGREPSADGFRSLGRMLGSLPAADPLILIEIGRVGSVMPRPLDDVVTTRVRQYLKKKETTLAIEAIMAVRQLQDDGAVPILVELMRSPDANVRKESYKALRAITEQRTGPDLAAWERWLKAEQRWFAREAPRLISDLERNDIETAAQAALELARHRLFRDDLAPYLEDCLNREAPELVRIACAGLGHFQTRRAVPRLVELLEHENPGVQQEAWRGLQRVSGQRLPPDPAAWSSLAENDGLPHRKDPPR